MGSNASSTTKVKAFHYQEPKSSSKKEKEPIKEKVNKVVVQPKPKANRPVRHPELVVDKEPTTSDEFKQLRKRLTTPGPPSRYRTTRFNTLQVILPGQIANDNNTNKKEHGDSASSDPDWRSEVKMMLPDRAVRRIHQIRIYPQFSKNSTQQVHTVTASTAPHVNNNKASKQKNVANSQNLSTKSSSRSSNDFVLEDIEDCGVTIGSCKNMQSTKGGLKYDVALYGHNKSAPKPVLNTSNAMCQGSQSSMKTKLKKKLWAAEVRRKVATGYY